MCRWIYGWIERQTDRWKDRQMEGQTDGWTDRWMDRQIGGQTDGWTDRWTGGPMDSYTQTNVRDRRADGPTDGKQR